MIDPRFYALLGPKPLSEIARIVGASVPDTSEAERSIETCAPLGEAHAGALAFCQGLPRDGELIATAASACLVRQEGVKRLPTGVVPLVVGNPRAVFAKAANALVERKDVGVNGPGIAPDTKLEVTVRTGIGVVIGSSAHIGAGTSIGPNSVIGPGVAIGRNCRIGANVVIYCALIGDRVTIASGSVIGESGFGVAPTPDGPVDVPQLGRVIIQDDVSIGSLCAVDRGAFGDTIVGLGCKIDNFTQIAHNCVLGRGVVIAAFGGISGSSEIGDNVLMGGRVGVGDHFKVGAGAVLGAASGVLQDVPAGEAWSGYPARPLRQWMRETIALKKLAQAKPAKKSE